MDGAKSVNRSFQNSFMDANKQESIDLLLQGNVYTGFAGSRARALLPFGDVACESVVAVLLSISPHLFTVDQLSVYS